MYNCKLQETVITITPTSRYGLPYDTARVETMFVLDTAIAANEKFLIPNMEKIPAEIMNFLKFAKVGFAPLPMSEVRGNISDFAQEVEQGQKEVAIADAALGIATQYMTPVQLQPITGNFYKLGYDYSIFPNEQGNFYINTTLPFRGFQMPQGQVRLIAVLPNGSQVDPNETKGITLNGQTIEEQTINVANGRPIISFFWQNDPDFTVKYRY